MRGCSKVIEKLNLITTAKKIKSLILGSSKSIQIPSLIVINTKKGELKFEVFSHTEYYRIAEYGGEKDFLKRFLNSLRGNDVIFDIGASVGLMTIHAAALAKQGQVFSFEPDPETMNRLRHNVSLNTSISNVTLIPCAVSDKAGDVELFTNGADGYAPTMREQVGRLGAPKNKVVVEAISLDSEVGSGRLPLPTVLKIDIEGAEALCLRGAKQCLSGQFGQKPRLIFLELHPEFLPDFGSTVEEVHELIARANYSVVGKKERDTQIHYCYEAGK